jgi:hypothetical protein
MLKVNSSQKSHSTPILSEKNYIDPSNLGFVKINEPVRLIQKITFQSSAGLNLIVSNPTQNKLGRIESHCAQYICS